MTTKEEKPTEGQNAPEVTTDVATVEATPVEDGKDVKESPADTEPKVIGLRERILMRGKKLYPEEVGDDVDDESYEKLASRILDDMDSKEGRLNTLLESNKKLFDIFNEDPEVFDVFELLKNGTPLPIALRKVYGEEVLSADENDEAYKKYLEEKALSKKAKADLEANAGDAEKSRLEFYKEADMSEEEIKSFEEAEEAMYEAMALGKLNKDYFKKIHKALTYEDDVKSSYEQGRVDAKNTKIEAKLKQQLGDGLPDTSSAGRAIASRKEEDSVHPTVALFKGIADKAKESKWQ